MVTRRPNIAEQDSEPDLSLSTSIQNKELLERAQLAAYFSHTNHELFSGIENGLTKLKGNQLLDQKSLALIELLGLRSGHAYRAAHLHHHRRFPHPDDIEGAGAHRSRGRIPRR